MTRWQFDNRSLLDTSGSGDNVGSAIASGNDDGQSVQTVASDSNSVTYNISSLSTEHIGNYYCVATIDGRDDTSIMYTLFGELVMLYRGN